MTEREKYLNLLKRDYPTTAAVAAEIINLEAIMSMPKGTEHFVSDVHGEFGAFCHLMNTCSGVIREKVDLLYKDTLSEKECAHIASLISYPKETIELWEERKDVSDEKYLYYMEKLVHILLRVASKYTRSKVLKAVQPEFSYIINELVNAKREGFDYEEFTLGVYKSVLSLNRAPEFIEAVAAAIKKLAVVSLHIVGDIFDRGEHPDYIMDMLLTNDSVDIQWGNHDIQWIGAFLGNPACIANILYIALKAGNVDAIEDGYGISLRRLEEFARKNYDYDERFAPANKNLTDRERKIYTRMRKAIFFMMLKYEEEIIKRNPEYGMEDRMILSKLDHEKGRFVAEDGKEFFDYDFKAEYSKPELSDAEMAVMDHLIHTFMKSEKLRKHMDYIMRKGGLYLVANGNLLYHGCVPTDENGEFTKVKLFTGEYRGKAYFDECERIVRQAYEERNTVGKDVRNVDFCWYLWCGKKSPLFGRDKIATFERVYLPTEYGVEEKNPCYTFSLKKEFCEKILKEFGIEGNRSHIINGHVPVKAKEGESPIRAEGKLLVIDGGFCRAYQSKTGIAGYTLIYNSYGLRLSAHEPFSSKEEAVRKCLDIHSNVTVFEHVDRRLTVADTDKGQELADRIRDLKKLL